LALAIFGTIVKFIFMELFFSERAHIFFCGTSSGRPVDQSVEAGLTIMRFSFDLQIVFFLIDEIT
jgi:hypothetical protein